MFNIGQVQSLPVTSAQLQNATRQDPVLSRAVHYTKSGWPRQVPEELKPYWMRRSELTIEGECLMWVVIPEKLQQQVLEELHQSHSGMVKTKALTRSYLWWPNLNQQIETVIKSCVTCQAARNVPAVAPLHPWTWPSKPWHRINIAFAGPFCGRMFVDAHSRWPEVLEMKSTTSTATIQELRRLFGLPLQLISDNRPQFTSSEFTSFLKGNGIKHVHCAPYHPSSNGAAERFVQSFKRAIKASEKSNMSFQQRLMSFLLTYRTTPHATTNAAPCTLFLKRQVRTRFDLLRPDVEEEVVRKQADQKMQHDSRAKRELFLGQRVMVHSIQAGQPWIPATVIERNGPLSYLVQVSGNRVWKRHIDHIREMNDCPQQEAADAHATPQLLIPSRAPHVTESPETGASAPEVVPSNSGPDAPPADVSPEPVSVQDTHTPPTDSTKEDTAVTMSHPESHPSSAIPVSPKTGSRVTSRYLLRDREKHRRFK